MQPSKFRITCPQGTTFQRLIVIKFDRYVANLTGYSARMQVRTTHSGPLVLEPAVEVSDPRGGEVSISITAEQSAALKAGTYVYDLELESPSGEVMRLIEGRFIITPEVTR
jgi:hypothetical protein